MLSPTKSLSFNYFQISQQANSQNFPTMLNNQLINSDNLLPTTPQSGNTLLDTSNPQPSGIFTHTSPNPQTSLSPSPIFNLSPSPDLFLPQDHFLSPDLPSTNPPCNQPCYNFQFPTSTDQPDIFSSSTDNQFNSIVNFLNLNPNLEISNLLTRIQNIQKTIDQYSQRTNLSSSYSNYINTLIELQNQFQSQLQSLLLFHVQNLSLSRTSLNSNQFKPHNKQTGACPTPISDSVSSNISNLQQRLSIINKKKRQSKNKSNIVQSALQQQLQFMLQLQRDQNK